jgi:hypothetical protein
MAMRTPQTIRAAEDFGRIRLSKSFFMRDFLYSDIARIEGMRNFPDDPGLAIAAGSQLCEQLLEPLQATFGRLAIRSAYRGKYLAASPMTTRARMIAGHLIEFVPRQACHRDRPEGSASAAADPWVPAARAATGRVPASEKGWSAGRRDYP